MKTLLLLNWEKALEQTTMDRYTLLLIPRKGNSANFMNFKCLFLFLPFLAAISTYGATNKIKKIELSDVSEIVVRNIPRRLDYVVSLSPQAFAQKVTTEVRFSDIDTSLTARRILEMRNAIELNEVTDGSSIDVRWSVEVKERGVEKRTILYLGKDGDLVVLDGHFYNGGKSLLQFLNKKLASALE